MKHFKRLLALVLAVVLLGAATACNNQGGSDKKKAYFISVMTGGAAWSRAEAGFKDACEKYGWEANWLAPVERNNAVEMAELLDKAVVAKADAIFGVFLNTDMFGPGLKKAREQGAVTASVQLTLPKEFIDFQIGTDQIEIGVQMAKAVIDKADPNKQYEVIYLNNSASEMVNAQFAAFESELLTQPNFKSLGIRFDEGSAATANQVITDELKTNPGLNVVVCGNSSAATIGTASFIQENGLEDEWITIGIDASADILNYVKNGALDATLNQDFYKMGYDAVRLAHEKIAENKEPEFINDTGTYVINPADVDKYAKDNGIDLGGK